MTFKDRRDAAAILAAKLQEIYGKQFLKEKPLVLAIPRGGVVTGDEISAQ